MGGQLTGAIRRSTGGFFRTLLRVSRQVFHEMTGALFGVFAFSAATSAWRGWHRGSAQWMVALSTGFALLMAAFAVSAFRSARRVR